MLPLKFEKAIPKPRFNRYLVACGQSTVMAKRLYRSNIVVSQMLHSVVGQFEVIFRHAVDSHYRRRYGEDWLKQSIGDGGMYASTGLEKCRRAIREALDKSKPEEDPDAIIPSLNFGFWVYLFQEKAYSAGSSTLLQIFPNKPKHVNQKKIFKELFKILELRNRIAHHEPICFNRGTHQISTLYSMTRYVLILDLLRWLNVDAKNILLGIDRVIASIKKINDIADPKTQVYVERNN